MELPRQWRLWKGSHWLGTGTQKNRGQSFLPFDQALRVARSLRLVSEKEWSACAGAARAPPTCPPPKTWSTSTMGGWGGRTGSPTPIRTRPWRPPQHGPAANARHQAERAQRRARVGASGSGAEATQHCQQGLQTSQTLCVPDVDVLRQCTPNAPHFTLLATPSRATAHVSPSVGKLIVFNKIIRMRGQNNNNDQKTTRSPA